MTIPEKVDTFLREHVSEAYCDRCIADKIPLMRPEQAQRVTGVLGLTQDFIRRSGICSGCGGNKLVIRALHAQRKSTHAGSGKIGRRAALLLIGGMGWYAKETLKHMIVQPASDFCRGLIDASMTKMKPVQQAPAHERADLIRSLFLDLTADTDVIPPSDWKPQKPDIEVTKGLWTYGHEWHVMNAIKGFLPESTTWEVSDKEFYMHPNHSSICLGSGVSNLATRDVLGSAESPAWSVPCGDTRVVDIPYAMSYLEDDAKVERAQYGRVYKGRESVIKLADEQIVARPETVEGKLVEDYLLVTRIPGLVRGTSRTYFAGLHGPGTRSTELLFHSIHPKELTFLADTIKLREGKTPYFQAIFRAREFRPVDGSDVAMELTCMRGHGAPIGLEE